MDRISITEELKAFKRKQMIITTIAMLIIIIVFASVINYYKTKEKALCGAIYNSDKEISKHVIKQLINNDLSKENIDAASLAMENAGFGNNGFTYIDRINGELYVLIGVGLLILASDGVLLYACSRFGKSNAFSKTIEYETELYKLSYELNSEKEYNKKQRKIIQDFIDNIAHQIKTPLSVISMKHDMLYQWIENTKIEDNNHNLEHLQIAQNNVFKIKSFIKKLLDISRIESGKVIMTHDEIILDSALIESAGNSVERVHFDFNDDNVSLYADESWLIEGLSNIIDNCSDSGEVFVETKRYDEKCRIIIADNGKGLSVKEFNQIFNRFETSGNANEFKHGIGLNLSKLIFEAHKGTIKAGNSTKYGGAEFIIELPIISMKSKLKM